MLNVSSGPLEIGLTNKHRQRLRKTALPQNPWKSERPLRERIASWDTPRSRWSYHASSEPGAPQDAYPDGPQSRREVQVVRLLRGLHRGAGRRPGPDRPGPAPQERPAILLRLPQAWSPFRPPQGTTVRVRPPLGPPGVPRLPDAARGLPPVRGHGGVGAVVRRQESADDHLSLVPGELGPASELGRGRGDLPDVLG